MNLFHTSRIQPKNHLASGQNSPETSLGSYSYLLSPQRNFVSESGNFGDIGDMEQVL